MRKTLLIAILSMVMINCSSDDNNESFTPQNIDFTTIGQGIISFYMTIEQQNSIEQQNTVITNQTDWNQLLGLLEGVVEISETDIDFDTFQVIASIDEKRGHTGHWVEITEIIENENNITVTIVTGEYDSGFTTICRPYHIVKITKSDKPVVFE